MAARLSEKDMSALEAMFIDAKGRGFRPRSMRAAVIGRALGSGWLRKADGDFFVQKDRGSHVVFTETGKACIVKRLASRYGMDADDAHHLVRTGSFHLVDTAVRPRREPADDGSMQTGF